jgi:hypothetical protein
VVPCDHVKHGRGRRALCPVPETPLFPVGLMTPAVVFAELQMVVTMALTISQYLLQIN